jgi:WD40 repeat protein
VNESGRCVPTATKDAHRPGLAPALGLRAGRDAAFMLPQTRGIAFSPDGRRLVTAGGSDHTLKLWDPNTGEEILTLGPHPGILTSVAFSGDGKRIVSSSQQDVRVWDATPLPKEQQTAKARAWPPARP